MPATLVRNQLPLVSLIQIIVTSNFSLIRWKFRIHRFIIGGWTWWLRICNELIISVYEFWIYQPTKIFHRVTFVFFFYGRSFWLRGQNRQKNADITVYFNKKLCSPLQKHIKNLLIQNSCKHVMNSLHVFTNSTNLIIYFMKFVFKRYIHTYIHTRGRS